MSNSYLISKHLMSKSKNQPSNGYDQSKKHDTEPAFDKDVAHAGKPTVKDLTFNKMPLVINEENTPDKTESRAKGKL